MVEDKFSNISDERLTALEAEIKSIKKLVNDLVTSSTLNERLLRVEKLIAEFQESLAMVSDVDTFSGLRNLLAENKFEEADRETARILLGMINKTADTITPDDIETFPLASLRIVDRLWKKYSGERFGLSVQLKIYRELGGDLNTLIAQDEELFFAFCDRVGWRKNGKFIVREKWVASLASPEGFLPLTWWVTPYGLKIGNFILARLIKGGF